MDRSGVQDLGNEIHIATSSLCDELVRLGSVEPTFEHGLPPPLQNDSSSAANVLRQKILHLSEELHALLSDPTLLLTPELRNPLISLHSIVRLGIAEAVPAKGATVHEVAEATNVKVGLVRRLLGHSAAHRIYFQQASDFFVHTAASKILLENAGMRQWILIGAEELLPATLKTANALMGHPDSEEPEHSGWSIQNNTNEPIFRAFANQPQRAMVFANAMGWHSAQSGYAIEHLISAISWTQDRWLLVDVGGGQGHVSRALAIHDSSIQCIVEDVPDAVAQGQQDLPLDLHGRVGFQAHDFFAEQPVKGADVYLLRLVLHDWSDKYAKKILEALVPALKPGATVMVQDRVVPAWGEATLLQEREARDYDMYMLAFQNAKERTVDDWTALFEGVDARFKLASVHHPPRSYLAVIQFLWNAPQAHGEEAKGAHGATTADEGRPGRANDW